MKPLIEYDEVPTGDDKFICRRCERIGSVVDELSDDEVLCMDCREEVERE